jgi:hypothetical protein
MKLKVETRDVPVKDIVFDQENPNWHSESEVEAMARSIENLFRIHDPLGYYDDGKCRLICGELRVRAEIRNGAKVIKGMKVLLVKPTERLIRELQATENINRRLDWVSRAETYLKLQETGLTSDEIYNLVSFDTPRTIQELTKIARLLRRVSPEIVEQIRAADAYFRATQDIANTIGVRVQIGRPPPEQVEVITDEDVAIAETVLRQLLKGDLAQTHEAVRSAVLELKIGNLEQLLEKEAEERELEVNRLLRQREQNLKAALEKQQKVELKKKEEELESHYQKLLDDRQKNIEALEARLKKADREEARAVARIRKNLEQERKARKALQEGLEKERKKIREELEDEFALKEERLLKAEAKKIREQVEQALAEREQKIKDEERRLELEKLRLTKERRDLEASREKLEDETARAHHIAKELIARRAELSAMVSRATDERFLELLRDEEKLQILQSFKDGIKDDLLLIQKLTQEGEEAERLRKLVAKLKEQPKGGA